MDIEVKRMSPTAVDNAPPSYTYTIDAKRAERRQERRLSARKIEPGFTND